MDIDNRCVVCHEKGEDGGHLFFKCPMVTEIWAVLGMEEYRKNLAAIESAREVVRLITELNNNGCGDVVVVGGEERRSVPMIVNYIKAYVGVL